MTVLIFLKQFKNISVMTTLWMFGMVDLLLLLLLLQSKYRTCYCQYIHGMLLLYKTYMNFP